MLKIYCALSAECTPERVHSTELPNAALASCVGRVTVVRYFVMYIVLGGPAPLGTLTIGGFCFVLDFGSLLFFSIAPSNDDTTKAAGKRVLAVFAMWVFFLVIYAVLTCLILEFKNLSVVFVVGFRI